MKIVNAKIYTCDEAFTVIDNGFVEVENGKITAVGECAPGSKGDIDAQGKTLFPGFIDCHTHLGLTTSGVGFEGEDLNESVDSCTPQLRIIDGINPLDYSFELARKAGVTAAVVSPGSANAVAGQIFAIKTTGKRIDKMSMGEVGIKFSLGENPKMTYNDRDETPVTRMAIAAVIREALYKAKRYGEDVDKALSEDGDLPEYDIKSEALLPLLERRIKAHFHCHRADDIFTAVRIANEFSLDYVLVHCTDGYLIADELAEEKCSAVIGPVICDRCKPEMASLSPENAAVLAKSGVKVAVCTDHSEVPIEYLPLSVGICRKHGLPFEDALLSVTRHAAEIAGIADRVGSIEAGKDADLVLFAGDPFEVMSSPEMVMIGGERIEL
ncbi:MAG: amidohydrolase [Ruminococcus sp.]|nr:amidohydrolase [Ruminococcus sp.]